MNAHAHLAALALLALSLSACGNGGPIAEPADAASPMPAEPTGVNAIYGTWAADPVWCNGGGEGTPIIIGNGRFEGRENSCDMTPPKENGGGWLVTLECQGEGMETSERIRLTPQDGRLVLTYIDRDGEDVRLHRCP